MGGMASKKEGQACGHTITNRRLNSKIWELFFFSPKYS